MKKIMLSLAVVICAFLCLSACGENDENKNSFLINFYNENNVLITSISVLENEVPNYSYNVNDTDEYDYSFKGWSLTNKGETLSVLPPATENASYYAIVERAPRQYTISFNSNGGNSVQTITNNYNSSVESPAEPTKENFRFVSWCLDPELTQPVIWPINLKHNVTLYACYNKLINVKNYLRSLLEGIKLNPYGFIPNCMKPDYSTKLISSSYSDNIFNNFTAISNISDCGYGEQWNMVLENLEQSKIFFNALNILDNISTASITAFNNYFDSNPESSACYSFGLGENNNYSISIKYDEEKLHYVVGYSIASIDAQIDLEINFETNEKNARIQLSDANALKYKITNNSYEFAIKYGGIRRAYFKIEKDSNNNVTGNISEFLTVKINNEDKEILSAADFYFNNENIIVVGNKADAILGFQGYICETYSASTGKIIGYEVKETLKSITYDTLWFNLKNISGLSNIKYISEGSESGIYVNNSSEKFENKISGVVGNKFFSRRYDIEMKKQYYFYCDEASGEIIKECLLTPMLFVQEYYLETLTSDINSKNTYLNISLNINNTNLDLIKNNYINKIPIFVNNKENINVEFVLNFIGDKYTAA